jgi:hypothetical protein
MLLAAIQAVEQVIRVIVARTQCHELIWQHHVFAHVH